MLPLFEQWYRKLLVAAVFLGAAGGVTALLYSGFTGVGIDGFFGEPTTGYWSGRWWWIPLVAGGGALVAALRDLWRIPESVPGSIAFAHRGWVDPDLAPRLVAISAVSLFTGASLGPSFGIIVAGGGMGAWLFGRLRTRGELGPDAPPDSTSETSSAEVSRAAAEAQSQHGGGDSAEAGQQYTLAGMAGGLGAVFSAPLFATVLVSELSSTRKVNYVAAFAPQFVAATIGYVIFFGVTGSVMLDAFELPGYTYEDLHLFYGAILGLLAVATLLVFTVIDHLVTRMADLVSNRYARSVAGGAGVGLIAFAVPLTANGGSTQLSFETANPDELGEGLLLIVLLSKMVAVVLSQRAGFLGGSVFPMLFIGGTAGIAVAAVASDIPISLAVAAMIASVPGAIIGAPLGFILIAVGGVGLGVTAIAPVGIAMITAHVTVSAIKLIRATRRKL